MRKIKTISNRLFITAFLVCLFSLAVKADKEPYLVKKFDASSVSYLEVNTSGGSIETIGSSGSKEIVVEMYVSSWKSKFGFDDIEEALEDYEIMIEKQGNKVVAFAKNKSFFGSNQISISFKVYSPSSISTELKTSGGSITATKLSGDQYFDTSGGSINMEDLNGEIRATTSGGSLNLKNINGTMRGTTSGGSIRSENLKGDFDLHTSGGSIRLDDVNGSIRAETSGGGINANILNVTGDITLKTSGGSIHATLPDNQGMDLLLKGNSVNTRLKNFSGESDDDRIEGSINGGGKRVTMITSGGSVNVDYQ